MAVYATFSPQERELKKIADEQFIQESVARRNKEEFFVNTYNYTCIAVCIALVIAAVVFGSPLMCGIASSLVPIWSITFFMSLVGMCSGIGIGGFQAGVGV